MIEQLNFNEPINIQYNIICCMKLRNISNITFYKH